MHICPYELIQISPAFCNYSELWVLVSLKGTSREEMPFEKYSQNSIKKLVSHLFGKVNSCAIFFNLPQMTCADTNQII